MTGSILSFSAMAVAGRAVSPVLDTFELMTWRSIIGFFLVVGVGAIMGKLGEIRATHLGENFVRNIFHFAGQNLWFWSLTVIPLAQVFALEFTSPLWVILMSPLLLGERITKVRAASALVGFLGILIVARPDITHLDLGVAAAAASAIGFAGSAVFTKRLTRYEKVISILFWLTVMQAAFGAIGSGIDRDVALPTWNIFPWLVVLGIAGVMAHLCLTMALTLAPATVVIPMDFVRLPAIAIVGMLLYGEQLDPFIFLGALVIFAANWMNIRSERRESLASQRHETLTLGQ
ncbi:MAG: EamA family transporter [Cereibacter sphaeroides]|uniref:EamA family transporter n=1 Tax=Cereibacter sphaeroides TaxID=1063 RepID=A0A2W5SIU2_CERSP|nr:MAG: EamA family transporter [Cereibacter sphaeroides]